MLYGGRKVYFKEGRKDVTKYEKKEDTCLSVIIPAYNSENFIDKCLNSVIEQKIANMEIIVVNDGSTDKTEQIIYSYTRRYNYIRLITTDNRGVAHARNIGLKKAKGKYVTFVDSDDYLEKDIYCIMLGEMEKYHADIVEGACRKEKRNGAALSDCTLHKQIINGSYNCVEHFLRQDNCCNYMCNKIYDRKLFNNRYFPNLCYSEDYYMNTLLHKNASCKVVLSRIVYHYVIHEQSACRKRIDLKRIDLVKAGVMTAGLFTEQHLKIYPCVYACDYCINVAKTMYLQGDRRLFRRFILLSRKDYLHMLREVSPVYAKRYSRYKSYWIYVFFAVFPKGLMKMLQICCCIDVT